VIVRLKTRTAKMIVITCLTLAATAEGRSEREGVSRCSSTPAMARGPTHSKRARLLVGREADDVEPKGDRAIDDERQRLHPVHLVRAKAGDAAQLTARPAVEDALDEGERRHAHEEVERMKLEPAAAARLEDVGRDRLECGEKGAEQGEEKAGERKVVVAVRPDAVGKIVGQSAECLYER
jgi:hypothetical protein